MELEESPIRAKIELLSTQDGGRKKPLRGPVSYRPNHNFFGENDREMLMGPIELAEGQSIAPGESVDVNMTLWLWPPLVSELRVGQRWRIQEGAQLVGWGEVLNIFGR